MNNYVIWICVAICVLFTLMLMFDSRDCQSMHAERVLSGSLFNSTWSPVTFIPPILYAIQYKFVTSAVTRECL